MTKVATDSLDSTKDAGTESVSQGPVESPIARAIRETMEGGLEFTGKESEETVAADDADDGKTAPDEEAGTEYEHEAEGSPEYDGGEDGEPAEEGGGEPGDLEADDGAAEGTEGEPGEVEREEPGSEGPEFVEVEAPGRREGETTKIRVHPEDEEAVRMLKNMGLRRSEFNQQMEAVRAERTEVEQFITELETDPVGLFTAKATPQAKAQMVREILLSDPQIRNQVADELVEFETNPVSLQRAEAQARADRLERQSELNTRHAEIKAAEAQAARVIQRVNQLIPEDAPDEDADAFFRDAMQYLEYAANKFGAEKVTENTVPELLADRLRLYGLTKAEGAAGSSSQDGASEGLKGSRSKEKKTATLENAKEGQSSVQKKVQKRKKIASAAPAGAGSKSTTGIQPPKGQTVAERLKWAAENRIFGAK